MMLGDKDLLTLYLLVFRATRLTTQLLAERIVAAVEKTPTS